MFKRTRSVFVAVILTLSMLFMSGCSGIYGGMLGGVIEETKPDECSPMVSSPGTPGELTGSENLQKAFNYLVSAGLTPEAAAGIAGNLQTESAAIPWLAEHGHPSGWGWDVTASTARGWGIVQWTWQRHIDARSYVVEKLGKQYYTSQYATPKAKDWLTPEDVDRMLSVQLEYLLIEMNKSYKKSTLDPIMAATSPEQAADIFVRKFEAPAEVWVESPIRQKQARVLYDKFIATAPPQGTLAIGSPIPTPPPTSTDGSNTSQMKFAFPMDPGVRFGSPYGMRLHPIHHVWKPHTGIDLSGGQSDNLYAVADGLVTYAGDGGGYGNFVVIKLANGDVARYAHLSAFRVKAGDQVKVGQIIGIEGTTGWSTGNHLHFEIIPKDKAGDNPKGSGEGSAADYTMDPAIWLDAHGFTIKQGTFPENGTPNGKVPSDVYVGTGSPPLSASCAPGGTTDPNGPVAPGAGEGTSPGSGMNPGPIPPFDPNALASATPRKTDNANEYVSRMTGYLDSVWGPQGIPKKDIFDYPSSPPSCHGPGSALDIMVPVDSVLGDTVAAWLVQYHKELNVSIIIWKQQSWSYSRSPGYWKPMSDRGGITANHRDHVHVSFLPCVG